MFEHSAEHIIHHGTVLKRINGWDFYVKFTNFSFQCRFQAEFKSGYGNVTLVIGITANPYHPIVGQFLRWASFSVWDLHMASKHCIEKLNENLMTVFTDSYMQRDDADDFRSLVGRQSYLRSPEFRTSEISKGLKRWWKWRNSNIILTYFPFS